MYIRVHTYRRFTLRCWRMALQKSCGIGRYPCSAKYNGEMSRLPSFRFNHRLLDSKHFVSVIMLNLDLLSYYRVPLVST